MKKIFASLVFVLIFSSTSFGEWIIVEFNVETNDSTFFDTNRYEKTDDLTLSSIVVNLGSEQKDEDGNKYQSVDLVVAVNCEDETALLYRAVLFSDGFLQGEMVSSDTFPDNDFIPFEDAITLISYNALIFSCKFVELVTKD